MSKTHLLNIRLESNEQISNSLNQLEIKKDIKLIDFPLVYILYIKNNKVYIGESTQVATRLKSHSKNKSKYKDSIIISNEKFNQSATYNIETKLINYFLADDTYKIDNIQQRSIKYVHDYYDKDYFNHTVFNQIWDQLLEGEFVKTSRKEIENSDVFKLSPFKELTKEQLEVQNIILDFCEENINKDGNHVLLIKGEAGTGKSVLLSSTFKRIMDLANDSGNNLSNHKNNYVLVNHTEMEKAYKSIARKIEGIRVSQFLKPTSFINTTNKTEIKADVTLVDEAHLLLTRQESFRGYHGQNHLEDIINNSKITIIFYDDKQVLRYKQYWDNNLLEQIISGHANMQLELFTQMRINSNEETQKWINDLVNKKLDNLPFDNKYDIKIFDDAKLMHKEIVLKNKVFGLSRVVSTFDYIHKKDGGIYYVEEGDFKLPWNLTDSSKSWAENESTINEVGSIYTIQGFDLNYVGVILGPSIKYDNQKNKIYIDTKKYMDIGAFNGLGELNLNEQEKIKEKIILNSLNVLLKRGIKGLYLYASDDNLRRRLMELQEIRDLDIYNLGDI